MGKQGMRPVGRGKLSVGAAAGLGSGSGQASDDCG